MRVLHASASRLTPLALCATIGACATAPGDPVPPVNVEARFTLTHTFPAFDLDVGQEVNWQCQSWTLGNEEPLYVDAVRMRTGGGWHHSNWMFVPDRLFPGPDGTWPCRDRGYEEVSAANQGGVFFAQTTQATNEEQRFPSGAAIRIPARAKIVGGVHLLNLARERKRTDLTFEVDVVPEADVEHSLSPVSFTYLPLDLPARRRSEFSTTCNLASPEGTDSMPPVDFKIYYFLPHYHQFGRTFRMEVVGGPRDGDTLFEAGGVQGDPLGQPLDPPFDMTGATGLRMVCGYENPLDTRVRWGFEDGEMCVVLAYTDSPFTYAGVVQEHVALADQDGAARHEGRCDVVYFRTRFATPR